MFFYKIPRKTHKYIVAQKKNNNKLHQQYRTVVIFTAVIFILQNLSVCELQYL